VGIVSRLVPIKNHRMFLQAARKIRMGNPSIKVKFVVIGDGELKQQLKSHVRELGLEDDVVFTGWVEDLVSAYADLDIVALTSLNEGTPVSLIEAMASARPVVATDVGGVRDVVEDGASGLLVAPNDVDSFASKLAELMNDAAKRKILGSRGRVAVMERYSKDHLVDEIDSLYKVLSFKKGAL
jgi:glycosyltransferase involved in cell wall biosynthesis